MVDPYFLRSLGLTGFRAYLQPKTFVFSKKRCLAIFAPNGSGKSSVIDALEFMFSKDGTLERLGQRAINNQAGPVALAHNLADEAQIAPEVMVDIVSGKEVATGRRPATGAKRPIPAIATTVNACFVVPPIIRGHALRTFVEVHTPEQRYTDVQIIIGGMVVMMIGISSLCLIDHHDENNPTWLYAVAMMLIYGFGYPIGHTAVIGLFSKSELLVFLAAAAAAVVVVSVKMESRNDI